MRHRCRRNHAQLPTGHDGGRRIPPFVPTVLRGRIAGLSSPRHHRSGVAPPPHGLSQFETEWVVSANDVDLDAEVLMVKRGRACAFCRFIRPDPGQQLQVLRRNGAESERSVSRTEPPGSRKTLSPCSIRVSRCSNTRPSPSTRSDSRSSGVRYRNGMICWSMVSDR